ncbi:MAG: hypothetical protein ABI232_01755 [Jatrophihabitantaceae bacterium]
MGTALAWLGHECPGTCPPEATGHHAAIWFAHLPDALDQSSVLTLVEVDFGATPWSDLRRNSLLHQINHCVRPDRLSVRERLAVTLAGPPEIGLLLHE